MVNAFTLTHRTAAAMSCAHGAWSETAFRAA
jgi:hypothetical protein